VSGSKHAEDGSYVLAKGGIKLNGRLSKAEQNREIIALFANRKPNDVLVYTLGIGSREEYVKGSDFVDKEVKKKLSMEFDWKRRPFKPQDADVGDTLFPETMPKHLSFQTVPWDDVRQFNRTRELWEDFRKSSPRCLTSIQDLKVVSDYFENMMSLEGEVGKYLRRKNGALSRLREILVIALQSHSAGTHVRNAVAVGDDVISPSGRVSARKLARYLDEVIGIPCKQTDVETARRKTVFIPGYVPNTRETREKLERLKEKLFPLLKIDDFLAAPITFELVHQPE
jgi:hypothetical protein